jgi:hypothetical protein
MPPQAVTSINCPNCRAPFTAPVLQVINAQENPEAKSRLLSGQLNVIVCPHCGFQGVLNAPFLYHDAELELALVYMPMELGTSDVERQKAIGDLTKQLMQSLPPEARKGYLFQPRTFFTVQGLVDALLEADEATRNLVEAQQRKLELLDQLRQLNPQDSLATAQFVGANDDELDGAFFRLLDIVIDIEESRGDTVAGAKLAQHRDNLLEKSATGRRLKAQQAAIEALAADPTRETLIEQLMSAEHQAVREALVTVGRQMLDYGFFQALTARIDAAEAAGDEDARERLIALRKEIQDIRDQVDAMALAVLDARARLLRDLMVAANARELLMRHVLEIDDAFLGVLATNIRQAESEGRRDLVEKLRNIGDMAIQVLNEFAPPEIQLINRLASAENNEQVHQLLEGERGRLDQDFLQLVEQASQDLEQAGRQENAERLRYAAAQIKKMKAVENA